MNGVVAALDSQRVVAVVRAGDRRSAERIARGALRGGVRVVELTLTTPGALDVLAALTRDVGEDVVLGTGTVTRPDQVAASVAAGARFVVSPHVDPAVIEAAAAARVLAVPGALTPTEVATAERAGATVVKLFPAATVGTSHLSALRQVFPRLSFVPTGGVESVGVRAWLDAGALAVGVGSALHRALAHGEDAVAAIARDLVREAGPVENRSVGRPT